MTSLFVESVCNIFIKNELVLYHKLKKDNKGVFEIQGLDIDAPKVYKAKKFACRSLKGRRVQSGIRVIYGYFEKENRIELIEIYYKVNKENEDKNSIMKRYHGGFGRL